MTRDHREADPRREALNDLVAVRRPLAAGIAGVRAFGWDSDQPLVLVTRAHVNRMLRGFLDDEFTGNDLEAWADAIEGREDLAFEQGREQLLSRVVFEMTNPELARAISINVVRAWVAQLE